MAEVIEKVALGDAVKTKFGVYAKYIIQHRALPDARDGLKPVQRRILYCMWEEGNHHDKPYRKAAKTVGATMGNYHPHGDSSIYEAMVRMSQDWVMLQPLVDLHGNNGSIDGDPAASMRYTEARLTKLAMEHVLQGMHKKGIVPVVDNFDASEKEPVVLPIHFPNFLVNGASGISAGYATEALPHNLGEVMRGCSALIENPDITVGELMTYIPAPDLPTGGLITNASTLKHAYETGKGSFTVRSRYVFEKEGRMINIVFTDVPYNHKKQKIVEKIAEIIRAKKVAGLVNVRDETGREGLRIVVSCKPEAVEVVLAYLFKNTSLQEKLHINMVAVHESKPQLLTLKTALKAFTDFRKETLTKELQFEKNRLEARLHLLEGFLHLTTVTSQVVRVIEESEGKADGRQKIMEQFGFSEAQAEAIVTMQLYRISKQDKAAFVKEQAQVQKELTRVNGLLDSERKLNRELIRQFDKLALTYGQPRLTEITQEAEQWEVDETDIVEEETVAVAISQQGYLKRSSLRSFSATQACGVKEGDVLILEAQASSKQYVTLVTSQGRFTCLPIHLLEELKWGDEGKHISSYTLLNEGEELQFAFIHALDSENLRVLAIKSNGQVRLSALTECKPSRKVWALAQFIKLGEGEHILHVGVVDPALGVGLYNPRNQCMAFLLEEIPLTGHRSGGVRGIHLREGEEVPRFDIAPLETLVANGYPQRPRGSRGRALLQPSLLTPSQEVEE